ncbi:gluconolaconase [candidate division KSB1 bacterium]|nr:gluconolaconase [candidate division KSB1 bacterium]
MLKKTFLSATLAIPLLAVVLFCSAKRDSLPQNWTLEPAWETLPIFAVPESVCPDTLRQKIYVTNINGSALEKDGDGFLSRLNGDGEIELLQWVTGLNAPKGLAIHNDTLFVADIDQLVAVSLPDGKVIARYKAENAVFLNDVAVGPAGQVVVSDFSQENSAIYRLQNGVLQPWLRLDDLKRPNGLVYRGEELIIGNSGEGCLRRWNETNRTFEKLACPGHGIDGIAVALKKDLVFSDWSGRIKRLRADGEMVLLMDTSAESVQAADISFWPQKKLLLVPTFHDNRIVAYRIGY